MGKRLFRDRVYLLLATCHVMRGGLWDPSLEIFISLLCLSFSPRKLSYLSSYPLDGRCLVELGGKGSLIVGGQQLTSS